MLLCSLYLQVILLLPTICLQAELFTYYEQKSTNESNKEDETIFTDVIKNISRVNNALQELIHNYEQIQKFYETNSFEKDYSSDPEIDDVYINKKRNKKRKSRTNIDKDSTDNTFPATVMIVSDESEIGTEENEDDTVKEVESFKAQLLESSKKHFAENITNPNRKEVENITTSENEKKLRGVNPKREMQILILQPQQAKENKSIFTAKEKMRKRKKKIKNSKTALKDNTAKITIPVSQQRPFGNVAKVIFAESFAQGKIWDDIAQKKPIKLRAIRTPNIEVQKLQFRSRKTPQTALVIVTRNNKRHEDIVDVPSSLEHVFSSDSEDLNSRIIRANILRHNYGEACMRLVVKKCYKACKEVKKLACRVSTCKSSFKEKFQEKSKKGCINEFRPVRTSSDEKNTTSNDTTFLKKYAQLSDFDDDDDDDVSKDATRTAGFPAETCYPFMLPETKTERPALKSAPHTDIHSKILRDRYERACARASSEKCNNACMYAYKTTCETYDCTKSKTKQFRKHCKKQCKKVYKSKSIKKSSETSSSSSSSDSSDSDTEFYTEDFE